MEHLTGKLAGFMRLKERKMPAGSVREPSSADIEEVFIGDAMELQASVRQSFRVTVGLVLEDKLHPGEVVIPIAFHRLAMITLSDTGNLESSLRFQAARHPWHPMKKYFQYSTPGLVRALHDTAGAFEGVYIQKSQLANFRNALRVEQIGAVELLEPASAPYAFVGSVLKVSELKVGMVLNFTGATAGNLRLRIVSVKAQVTYPQGIVDHSAIVCVHESEATRESREVGPGDSGGLLYTTTINKELAAVGICVGIMMTAAGKYSIFTPLDRIVTSEGRFTLIPRSTSTDAVPRVSERGSYDDSQPPPREPDSGSESDSGFESAEDYPEVDLMWPISAPTTPVPVSTGPVAEDPNALTAAVVEAVRHGIDASNITRLALALVEHATSTIFGKSADPREPHALANLADVVHALGCILPGMDASALEAVNASMLLQNVVPLVDAVCGQPEGRVGFCRTLATLLVSPSSRRVAFFFEIGDDSPMFENPMWIAALVGDATHAPLELAEAWMQLVVAAYLADPVEVPAWVNVPSLAEPVRILLHRFPDSAVVRLGAVLFSGKDVPLNSVLPATGSSAASTGRDARRYLQTDATLADAAVAIVRPPARLLRLVEGDDAPLTVSDDAILVAICDDRRPYLSVLFGNVERVWPGHRSVDGALVCVVQLAGPLTVPVPPTLQLTATTTRGRRVTVDIEVVANDATATANAPVFLPAPRPKEVALAYDMAKRVLLPLPGVTGIAELPFRWVGGNLIAGWGVTVFVVCKGVVVIGGQTLPRRLEVGGASVHVDVLQSAPVLQPDRQRLPIFRGEEAGQRHSMTLQDPLRMGCGIGIFERQFDNSTYKRCGAGTLGAFATRAINGERVLGFLTAQHVVARRITDWLANTVERKVDADHFERVVHPATDESRMTFAEAVPGSPSKLLTLEPKWKPKDVNDVYCTTLDGDGDCMTTIPPRAIPLGISELGAASALSAGDVAFVPFHPTAENMPKNAPKAEFAITDVALWNAAFNDALDWMTPTPIPKVALRRPPVLRGVDDALISRVLGLPERPAPELLTPTRVLVAGSLTPTTPTTNLTLAFKVGYMSGLSLGRFVPGRVCVKFSGHGFTYEQHDALMVMALDPNTHDPPKRPTMLSSFSVHGDSGALVCSWSAENPAVCQAVGILDGGFVATILSQPRGPAISMPLTWLTPLSETILKELGDVELKVGDAA